MKDATDRMKLSRFRCAALALAIVTVVPKAEATTIQTAAASAPTGRIPVDNEQQNDLARLRLMIDRGQGAAALIELDRLAAETPTPSGVNTLRGIVLYGQEKLPEADAAFAKALQENPKDKEAAQMRGLTLFRLGKPAEAVPLLELAHDWTANTKADPNYVLARCYIELRRYDDARRAFASQYGFEPESASAYLLTSRMLLRNGYLSVAQQFAEQAISRDPQMPLAHELLGEIALAQARIEEAVKQLEQERARNPLEASVYDRLGDAYTRMGEYTKAQQVLEQAILLEPNATGPYIQLGKVLLRRRDPVNAAMYLERAEKMDPANSITHNLLAQAYGMLGRNGDAKRQNELGQSSEH
jgi:predicted Zn-dependent protease